MQARIMIRFYEEEALEASEIKENRLFLKSPKASVPSSEHYITTALGGFHFCIQFFGQL